MGDNKKHQFLAKKIATGRKNDFCLDFFVLLHIYPSRRNFLVFINFSYLQPFREIMRGRGKKALQTNNAQTNTTDDYNTPSGFFQNPRANNYSIVVTPPTSIVNSRFKHSNEL